MRVTNEQAKWLKEYDRLEDIRNLSADLLEARELIKEMREQLEDARTVMGKYEAQLTGELFNDPSLNDILDRTKEYT